MENNFNGKTNEEFIQIFTECLYCRMELTNYTYPHEFLDEDDAFSEHLNKCNRILYQKLYEYAGDHIRELKSQRLTIAKEKGDEEEISKIENEPFSHSERDEVAKLKRDELSPLLDDITDQYYKEVKIIYIDL